MRQHNPLILGAGPAGCAAAITLARAGAQPLLIDRCQVVGDPLCGGFLSWQTVRQLEGLGVDFTQLGAHRVSHLRVFSGSDQCQAPLPEAAFGLSRHALDTAMRALALQAGAQITHDQIVAISGGVAQGRTGQWQSDSIFLASGKEDVRGHLRPRVDADPALGLRLRLPPSPDRQRLLEGCIELHLFRGGYAGIVLQEGGWTNICLALRKSALARLGGNPVHLLEDLAAQSGPLAARLGDGWTTAKRQTIGAVPYGWIARETLPGLFRIGDQAAVIPSLAGEGIGIALASGTLAAQYWQSCGGEGASSYQRDFARRANRPVRVAALARKLAESPQGARVAISSIRLVPQLLAAISRLSRIALPPPLAQR